MKNKEKKPLPAWFYLLAAPILCLNIIFSLGEIFSNDEDEQVDQLYIENVEKAETQTSESLPNEISTTQAIPLSTDLDSMFNDSVTQFESISFEQDNNIYTFCGVAFGSLESNVESAVYMADDGEAISQAFNIGLQHGLKDFKSMDSLIAIYYTVTPNTSVTSPRDLQEVSLDISLVDEHSENGLFLYNSGNGNFSSLEEISYFMVSFGAYSDTKTFTISFGEKNIDVNTEQLEYTYN